jgi:DNA topoisomerase I
VRKTLARAIVEGDGPSAAEAVDLNYVSSDAPGLTRQRRGKGFVYRDARGEPVRDPATLARIRSLAIPPAWSRVWISADPDGHLQATGYDVRGRKQYRYHARWRTVRDAAKYHRLVGFCHALPRLRRAVQRDLSCSCLCQRKVVAAVVTLMECCQLRVGNDEYARTNGSYGATTLRDHHARFTGAHVELCYRGKSGIVRKVRVTDRRLGAIVRRCRDLPGQRLFQYVGDGGSPQPISSTDVNDYIREVTGGPYTAKDYRTWAASMGAALMLCGLPRPTSERAAKRAINEVLAQVADRLGHTVSVCRKAYVHPGLIDGYRGGGLDALARKARRLAGGDPLAVEAMRAIEGDVARFLAGPVSRPSTLPRRETRDASGPGQRVTARGSRPAGATGSPRRPPLRRSAGRASA